LKEAKSVYYVSVFGYYVSFYSLTADVDRKKMDNTIALEEGYPFTGELNANDKVNYFSFTPPEQNLDIEFNLLGPKQKLVLYALII
jgi:hypothetical protein